MKSKPKPSKLVALAAILFPESKTITPRKIACARFVEQLQKQDLKEGKLTYAAIAAMLYSEYHSAASKVKVAMQEDAKAMTCSLADVSAKLRGGYAFALVPVTKRYDDLHRLVLELAEAGNFDQAVETAREIVSATSKYRHVGVYITRRLNGVLPVAWTNRNLRNAGGKQTANDIRVSGWLAAGLLSDGTLTQSLSETGKEIAGLQAEALKHQLTS